MENVRYNISPCSADEVAEFIKKIDPDKFVSNGVIKATERSHYDRYLFTADDSRVAVVYDTTANILSVTGPSVYASSLRDMVGSIGAKTVKTSTVPAHGSSPTGGAVKPIADDGPGRTISGSENTRAKLFVSPEALRHRKEFTPVPTMFVSAKGAMMSTDEIYPPQVSKSRQERPAPINEGAYSAQKRRLPSYGEGRIMPAIEDVPPVSGRIVQQPQSFSVRPVRQTETRVMTEYGTDDGRAAGVAISVSSSKPTGTPRRATISFGCEDDDADMRSVPRVQSGFAPQSDGSSIAGEAVKRKRGRPPKEKPVQDAEIIPTIKRKRGRPPKVRPAQNDLVSAERAQEASASGGSIPTVPKTVPEYKNGYAVKNFTPDALNGALSRLREGGNNVSVDQTEFAGTPQEVKNYVVTDETGQKVFLRYATKRQTLQLQGKSSKLFYEVMTQVSHDSDYSSALENYVESGESGTAKVSDIQNRLKKRLPTAYDYLSEQSRIDFSYGIHDFAQKDLQLSDYSVLLVPAFRGLERFVFDLQSARDIKVKMIGQAFDKDDSGRYILKSGYTRRINSVIYPEVLVSLYTEYFSRRNFFAHSDNTENNMSRSLPDRAVASRIFEHILDVVEYNAKKLKEIGFKIVK